MTCLPNNLLIEHELYKKNDQYVFYGDYSLENLLMQTVSMLRMARRPVDGQ